MRTLLLAVLLSTPITAQAQTPRDLARLAWGGATPTASVTTAPNRDLAAAGGASAADLARLSWGNGALAVRSAASTAWFTSGATPRDLARLTGPARGVFAAPNVLLAARTARPHG